MIPAQAPYKKLSTLALAALVIFLLTIYALSISDSARSQGGRAATHTPTPTATPSPTLTPTPTPESDDDGVSGKGCDPGNACYEEIEIRRLSSSLAIGSRDEFNVRAFDLDRNRRYRIRVRRDTGNSDIGFNSRCSYSVSTASVPARSSDHERTLTLYACATTGGTVTAELLPASGSTVYATASQRVSVVRATATPTPTNTPQPNTTDTPTPTPTHTPRSNPTSTPTPDSASSSSWTTYIISAKERGDNEYGYEEDDFGSIGGR